MRKTWIFILPMVILCNSCQTGNYTKSPIVKLPEDRYSVLDTIPDVSYEQEKSSNRKSAIFFNEVLVSELFLKCVKPEDIDSINVQKDSIRINDENYYGIIKLFSNSDYKPKIISLKELLLKYTTLDADPDLILFEDEIISKRFDEIFIDEKFILKIIVQEVKTNNRNEKLTVIKLISRTKENVEEANKIYIGDIEEF